ncbi:hypothetical protein AAVH_31907, partial [Aphelenchoides avenae]
PRGQLRMDSTGITVVITLPILFLLIIFAITFVLCRHHKHKRLKRSSLDECWSTPTDTGASDTTRDDGGTILACDLIISKHPIGSGLFGAVYEARLPMKNQYFGQEGVSGSSCRKDSPPRQGSQIS